VSTLSRVSQAAIALSSRTDKEKYSSDPAFSPGSDLDSAGACFLSWSSWAESTPAHGKRTWDPRLRAWLHFDSKHSAQIPTTRMMIYDPMRAFQPIAFDGFWHSSDTIFLAIWTWIRPTGFCRLQYLRISKKISFSLEVIHGVDLRCVQKQVCCWKPFPARIANREFTLIHQVYSSLSEIILTQCSCRVSRDGGKSGKPNHCPQTVFPTQFSQRQSIIKIEIHAPLLAIS